MTEKETLTKIILDSRNSLETAQAAVCDLLDDIAVELIALESLSKLMNESNICTTIETGNHCGARDCGISR